MMSRKNWIPVGILVAGATLMMLGLGGCANNCRTITTTWTDARSINIGVPGSGSAQLPAEQTRLNGQSYGDGPMSVNIPGGSCYGASAPCYQQQAQPCEPQYQPRMRVVPIPQEEYRQPCPTWTPAPPPPVYVPPPTFTYGSPCW